MRQRPQRMIDSDRVTDFFGGVQFWWFTQSASFDESNVFGTAKRRSFSRLMLFERPIDPFPIADFGANDRSGSLSTYFLDNYEFLTCFQ